MNSKEKILRTELVSAGAALLCCLLLCIACFLLAGPAIRQPDPALQPLCRFSLVILPCALTWYTAASAGLLRSFLTLGFYPDPQLFFSAAIFLGDRFWPGLASGLFAAAVQGFHLAARREMPCTAWAAYGGLTVLYLFVSLLESAA